MIIFHGENSHYEQTVPEYVLAAENIKCNMDETIKCAMQIYFEQRSFSIKSRLGQWPFQKRSFQTKVLFTQTLFPTKIVPGKHFSDWKLFKPTVISDRRRFGEKTPIPNRESRRARPRLQVGGHGELAPPQIRSFGRCGPGPRWGVHVGSAAPGVRLLTCIWAGKNQVCPTAVIRS